MLYITRKGLLYNCAKSHLIKPRRLKPCNFLPYKSSSCILRLCMMRAPPKP